MDMYKIVSSVSMLIIPENTKCSYEFISSGQVIHEIKSEKQLKTVKYNLKN